LKKEKGLLRMYKNTFLLSHAILDNKYLRFSEEHSKIFGPFCHFGLTMAGGCALLASGLFTFTGFHASLWLPRKIHKMKLKAKMLLQVFFKLNKNLLYHLKSHFGLFLLSE
jgi:hypothetical protein